MKRINITNYIKKVKSQGGVYFMKLNWNRFDIHNCVYFDREELGHVDNCKVYVKYAAKCGVIIEPLVFDDYVEFYIMSKRNVDDFGINKDLAYEILNEIKELHPEPTPMAGLRHKFTNSYSVIRSAAFFLADEGHIKVAKGIASSKGGRPPMELILNEEN